MTSEAAAFDDDFDDLDDIDAEDGEEERGLSGLVVLLMGLVMLGALCSVIWIAYQNGVKTGASQGEAPLVTADPEPLKIENTVADAASGDDRAVYDRVDGAPSEPVEVIADGAEEPVERNAADAIGTIAAGVETTSPANEDAVADRIAELARADEAAGAAPAKPATPIAEPKPAATPTPASVETTVPKPAEPAPAIASAASGDALSGSHLVQIGAFRSQAEADGQWAKLQGKLGGYLNGKSNDVEKADLGAKGVYYRLRVGPFQSANQASDFCSGLKQRGTDCLIKAK